LQSVCLHRCFLLTPPLLPPSHLMSPAMVHDQRSPLLPVVHNNILLADETLPPLSLPEPLKGEKASPAEGSLALAYAAEATRQAGSPPPGGDDRGPPRADAEGDPERGVDIFCTEEILQDRDASDCPKADVEPRVLPISRSTSWATTPGELEVKANDEDDAESAIQALLALQRDPSPTVRDNSPSSRAGSPGPHLQSAIQKSDSTIRFYCRFPRCGKGYASTDAVRKHCRQRHLEWLRRLGHGCPALYCRWEE